MLVIVQFPARWGSSSCVHFYIYKKSVESIATLHLFTEVLVYLLTKDIVIQPSHAIAWEQSPCHLVVNWNLPDFSEQDEACASLL